MQPVVQPAVPARSGIVRLDDADAGWIDVKHGIFGIVQAHEERGQRVLVMAVEIVRFVFGDHAGFGDLSRRNGGADSVEDPARISRQIIEVDPLRVRRNSSGGVLQRLKDSGVEGSRDLSARFPRPVA